MCQKVCLSCVWEKNHNKEALFRFVTLMRKGGEKRYYRVPSAGFDGVRLFPVPRKMMKDTEGENKINRANEDIQSKSFHHSNIRLLGNHGNCHDEKDENGWWGLGDERDRVSV